MKYTKSLSTAAAVILALGCVFLARSQSPGVAPRYEVAIIKWDGPDKIQFITPQKSESLRVFKSGSTLPSGIHEEEFCLTWAANKLALEGWEPVNLDDTRILMRRAVVR